MHADRARKHLRNLVKADLENHIDNDRDRLSFFIRYAREVIDQYGRLLGYINVNVPTATDRPLTYNERVLQAGLALPNFIWPDTDPFKTQKTLLDIHLTGAVLSFAFQTSGLFQRMLKIT